MDEYKITLLSCLMLSYEYVHGSIDIYGDLGSVISLVCQVEKLVTEPISWIGPPNQMLYAVGPDVEPDISSTVSVQFDPSNRSNLKIMNFTKNRSGLFKCYTSKEYTEFNVIIKRDPSDISIVNATNGTLTCVEGIECSLACTVNSGKPGGNLNLAIDGVTVANHGPSHVIYNLEPKRSHHGIPFECEAFNSDGRKILDAIVFLAILFIPNINIKPHNTIFVKEEEKLQLKCINDGNDPTANTTWRRNDAKHTFINNKLLTFKNVNRTDAGLYICNVHTIAGVFEANATVVVKYPPLVRIEQKPGSRQLFCIPNGIPATYTFLNWEHKTEYMEHLRFLPSNNGTLEIPDVENETVRHHDRGIYICRVSNNVSSSKGLFVMAEYSLFPDETPYFVSSNNNIQYGILHKTTEMELKFVSYPEDVNITVKKNGSPFNDFEKSIDKKVNLSDTMYGQRVTVEGSTLFLRISLDSVEDFCLYEVEIRNVIGSCNMTVNLKSANGPFMPQILQTMSMQTSISVWWKPGFDGGYQQWYIIEYRKDEQFYWNNLTERSFNSTVINGLQPATGYFIRMFARNMINDSNTTDEFFVKTDADTVEKAHLYGLVSFIILPFVLLIATAYFKRGKVIQFINSRINNQEGVGVIENGLYDMQNNLATNAEVPVYSSIERRQQLSLHQTVSYSIAKKRKPNPLSHRQKQSGSGQNRLNKFKSSKDNEAPERDSSQLNYIEVSFEPKPTDYEFRIHGNNNRTDYVDIDFSQKVDPSPHIDSDKESDDDFASKDDIREMKK